MGIVKIFFYKKSASPLEVVQLRIVWYCIFKIKVARK